MTPWPLPAEFVTRYADPNWRELQWGITHGWADSATAIAQARRRLTGESDSDATLKLAGLRESEMLQVPFFVDQLADGEAAQDNRNSADVWIYLVFRYVLENRDKYPNALAIAEELYADFNYPREVEPFVRYMPATDGYDPTAHSIADNEQRLYRNWQDFVKRMEARFGSSPHGQGVTQA